MLKVKGREIRKQLTTTVMNCRERVNFVLSELRNVKDLKFISNDLVAKLNDMAYKAIKKGNLNKMLDKRAIHNE